MGCDIHFFVERFTDNYEHNGPKSDAEKRDNKIQELVPEKREPKWVSADDWIDKVTYFSVNNPIYDDRNYYVFAVLAGVRNSYQVSPLFPDRGVPEDISYPVKCVFDSWEGDSHSETFFTLKELLDVDWSKYNGVMEFKDNYGEKKTITVDRTGWLDDIPIIIDKLKNIDDDPNKVRCVIFFDN